MTIANCRESESTREAVRQRLSEEISSSSERSLKFHLASCPGCASLARALDPTLLFVPLGASAAAAPAAEDVRRVTEDVLAEVRRRTRVTPAAPRRPLLSRRFLQAAALVALAAGLFGIQEIRRAPEREARLAPSAGETPTAGPRAETVAAAGAIVRPSVRPLIQDLKNPKARVYEFAGVSAKDPTVVFIADPHADL